MWAVTLITTMTDFNVSSHADTTDITDSSGWSATLITNDFSVDSQADNYYD